MKKKYDLVFGIGQACSCSQVLRNSELQQFSYPLDWLWGNDIEGRINLLCSDFDRLVDKNDLEDTGKNNGDKDNLCEIYQNNFNKIVFNHDFLFGESLDKTYPLVKEKYERRIKRLLNQIEEANSILIVYLETPMEENKLKDNHILIDGFSKIINKYPNKNIDLLYFTNDMSYKAGKYDEEQITPHIIKITGHYKSTNKKDIDIIVSYKFFRKFFNKYELNLPLNYRIKRTLVKTIIPFIPIKKVRKSMRKKYHVMH